MGKSSPKPPAAPDPADTARAQTASNKDTAIYQAGLNRVDQYTPWGSQTYTSLGKDAQGVPKYRSDIRLTPQQQALLNQQQSQDSAINNIAGGYLNKIGGVLGKDYNYAGLPAAPKADANERQRIEQALFDRLNPQIDRDRTSLDAKLANQGILQGTEAYRNAQDDFNRGVNDARLGAVAQGGQEMSNLFNLGMASRQQGIQEYDRQRNAPLNEFNALRSAAQITNPQFGNAPQVGVGGTDVMGAINSNYAGQQNAYNQQVASQNSGISSLFGLGGALGSAWIRSDERLKENIVCIGETPAGLGVYEFNYIGDDTPQVGVMAQEVEKLIPAAVITAGDGFKRVNYAMVR